MAEYYLISQLPSLDGISENMPVPVTEERFLELCDRFLSKKAQKELSRLSLVPSQNYEKSGSALIEAWNENERNLRYALAKVRAEKMKKSFDTANKSLPAALMKAAYTAVETESPLDAEKFLNQFRLDFLDTLRPMDGFSEDFVFYYWLRLKLILRLRQFDADTGKTAYRNIYSSILNGERSEVIQ